MKQTLLLSVIFFFSCSRPVPELTGFDRTTWKNDARGCNGSRIQFLAAINEQRDKLKGLSESDLVTVLGNPDKKDLSEHHEKFYSYFVEPAPDCKGDSATTILEVRFNATGVSKEVAIVAID